ncbi:MAG: PA0069 family radical SAM protein [Candidatus Omnitrophica bacterium]|nr:PA0069 family radical SAM protein [Candidatus Omnitrophota bacterium]
MSNPQNFRNSKESPHRGADWNPQNRFDKIVVEPDPDCEEAPNLPLQTEYFKDTTRRIISYNDSPDIGFRASLNPYRGCEHGCIYCLSGETPILMADGRTKSLENIQPGDEIYGTVRQGWYRRYVKTKVLAHWQVIKPAYRIVLQDGTELIAGADHRFLTERGWKFVTGEGRPHLTINNKLTGVGQFAKPPVANREYQKGYLCGMIRGDALLAFYEYQREGRVHGNQYQFRLALIDMEGLQRVRAYLLEDEIVVRQFIFQKAIGLRKTVHAIATHARRHVEYIDAMIAWSPCHSLDWCKGFLAGIFDTEGGYNDGVLRIANKDLEIISYIRRCLELFNFAFAIEDYGSNGVKYVRILGGLKEYLRFFHVVGPSISRKMNIEGQAIKSNAQLGVVSIEPVGVQKLFDITTGTEDFIANGVVSHNCYARPTHEYFGLSAGLDFESKIFAKEDAAKLLRKELSRPKWEPQTIVMSGVTDPYQPVERKLGITRQCLEVLNDFRNPVAIITKNHLVARDKDIYSEMAKWQGCMVNISVTSLRREIARVMEPRASIPEQRLKAIEDLTKAGVPVNTMVAPIIPGLNDEEIPTILKAVAAAGAKGASFVILRLPWAVKDLFEKWAETHFPERKDKILNRLRELRGGKLYNAEWGTRMRGEGKRVEMIEQLFELSARREGLNRKRISLSTAQFRSLPQPNQLILPF